MDGTIVNAVVELRSTHSQDLSRLNDFKTQGGQGIRRTCETFSCRHGQFRQSARFNGSAML
jgi:hypothetical protein